MNINQLAYGLKLAETKNFTKASKQLFISQPTLSQQIKLLEEELGVTLFVRNKRKEVTLTEAGNDFIYYSQRILSDIDKFIHDFNKLYPLIKIKIYINGSSILLDQLQEDELDVAFVTGNFIKSDQHLINFDLVSQSDIAAIMNKNHHLAGRTYVTAYDLDREKIMMTSKYSNIYPELKKSIFIPHVNPIVVGESSQADVCLQVAESGLAISFSSIQVVECAHNPKIVSIPFKPTIKRNIYLATKVDSYKNNVISTFRESAINYWDKLGKS